MEFPINLAIMVNTLPKRPPSPKESDTISQKKQKTTSLPTCNKCGESFQGQLQYHQRNGCSAIRLRCKYSSGDVYIQPKDGVYSCIYCPRYWKKADKIQAHARDCPRDKGAEPTSIKPSPTPELVETFTSNNAARSSKELTTVDEEHEKYENLVLDEGAEVLSLEEVILNTGKQREKDGDVICAMEMLTTEDGIPLTEPTGDSQKSNVDSPMASLGASTTPPTPKAIGVLKPDHSCDTPDFLRRTTFVVNTKFWVLICLECQHAVASESAMSHLRKHHKQCTPPPSFQKQLEEHYPNLKAGKIHPGKEIQPVFGLMLHANYLVCGRCLHGYRNHDTLRKHPCSAGRVAPSNSLPYTSHVQTFFAGIDLCYFPVIISEDEGSDTTSHYSLFHKQHKANEGPPSQVSIPDDHRQLLEFLRKQEWTSHVQGLSPQELAELVQPPESGGPFQYLGHHVYEVMDKLQSSISAFGYLLQRLIGRRPSTARSGAAHIPHSSIEIPTLKRYSKTITSLISFLLRCHLGWTSAYKMTLTTSQSVECSKLLEHLKSAGTKVRDACADESFEEPLVDDEEEDSAELGSFEEEMMKSEVSSVLVLSSLAIFSVTDRCLLDFLSSFFTHLPTGNEDKFSPIVRFLILESLQPRGDWLPPRRITGVIAVLTFIGRQVMFYQVLKAMNTEKESRCAIASRSIHPYLDEELEGPLSTLYLLKRLLDRISLMEEGSALFTALDFTGQNIIVNGKALHVADIKFFVESIIEELRHSLLHDLFFGISDLVDVEDWSPGVVNEEPRNMKPRYSCFTDPHNSFTDNPDLLLRAVLDHPQVSGRFHFVDQRGELVWKAAPCLAYLKQCEAFEMLLFVASHTTVGEPPRGTEVAAHCLRNIPGGNIRNVFILFQYFCFMGTFNKSVAHQGLKIMRVPHPEVGRIWSLYLSQVRPLVSVWQGHFNGHAAALRAENNLFFGLHRRVTSSDLSVALGYHTSRLLNIRISISLWRHIATWFLNHHAIKFQEHLAMANRAALATQMGHSEYTHGLYAGDARLPSGVDFHIFFQSMKTSGVWHELLGFPPTLFNAMNATSSNSRQDQALPGKQLVTATSLSVLELLDQAKASLMPDILRLINQTRARDLATVLTSIGVKPQALTSVNNTLTMAVSPARLSDLRCFLKDPNARFKTQQQAEVTEALASGAPSLMVIGPTGSGKTLPVMLNISQHDRGQTTVFILPLLAMHDEYHERARRYGLSSESWIYNSSINQPPQLLLVAVERCTWESLKCYLQTLHHLGRLMRIVFDEAHLLLKHEGFRPCMNLLKFLGGLPVSIMLMTATCPPSLEREMFLKIGRESFQVLRQSTHRPEIQQRLALLRDIKDDKALQASVAAHIQALVPSLQREEQMLLFCLSHSQCDEMADLLGWKPYHARITQDDRAQSMQMWKTGQIRGLACTSMLNCCLDYPHVRYVFHLGLPRDAVDYSQAIGRCSRDGNLGTAITYYRPRSRSSNLAGEDRFGRSVINQMVEDSSLCLTFLLERFLDGQGSSCFSRPHSTLCGPCEKLTLRRQEKPKPAPGSNPPLLDTLFVAAYSQAQNASDSEKNEEEDFGRQVRAACDILYKCCVYCWIQRKECTIHTFKNCAHASEFRAMYLDWADDLVFPTACCFFCGGPQRLRFRDLAGQRLHVHDHPSDKTCHWSDVFKPLAFFLYRSAGEDFRANIPALHFSEEEWTRWLCKKDDLFQVLNMVKLLQQVCLVLPLPFIDNE